MRKFIRHPSEFPLEFKVNDDSEAKRRPLKNIGAGGLCFLAEQPITQGSKIHIHIPLAFQHLSAEAFDADGYVAWCTAEGGRYAVGVEFDDQSSRFGMRMVEQMCYIEQYRAYVLTQDGRQLSSEEAACEWIERYAAEFPH